MVAENAIPPHHTAVLEAFLRPGFTVHGIAQQLGLPIAAILEILTSDPVAAALDTIRQLQHDHLEMAQTAAFAAATDALSKLLPTIQDQREVRRSATAILRSIRPARTARRTPDYTTRHAAAVPPGTRPSPPSTSTALPVPVALPTRTTASSTPSSSTALPMPDSQHRPSRNGETTPSVPRHMDTWTPSFSSTRPRDHLTTLPRGPARLAAAAGMPGPAP